MQPSKSETTYLGSNLFVTLEAGEIRLQQGSHVVVLDAEVLEAFETWLSEERAREPE